MKQIVVQADFTYEELVAYLEARPMVEGFMTAREWAGHFGVGIERMRQLLAAAASAGILEVSRSPRPAIDGIMRYVPVYRLEMEK